MKSSSQSDSSPLTGVCRAKGCGRKMLFRDWPAHRQTHQRSEFPVLDDGTRALFASEAYDISNDKPVKESL